MTQPRLPKSAQEIADVIGVERTLYLIGKLPRVKCGPHAGKQSWRVVMYVPKTLPPDHPLVRILGWPDAYKLSRYFPGEILTPATCDSVYRQYRDQAMRQLAQEGKPLSVLAQWFGVTERQARNIVREEATT